MNLMLYAAYIPALWLTLIIVSDMVSSLWSRRKLILSRRMFVPLAPLAPTAAPEVRRTYARR